MPWLAEEFQWLDQPLVLKELSTYLSTRKFNDGVMVLSQVVYEWSLI
jgi:hypothetical protein